MRLSSVRAVANVRRAVAVGVLSLACGGITLVGCGHDDRSATPSSSEASVSSGPSGMQDSASAASATANTGEHAAGPTAERGRYIVLVGGCNDCHTPGFMEKGTAVPESTWLTGVPVGWKGPWGTTYASNLRLFLKDFDEDTFVQVVRARNSRPPMPWPNLHSMSDRDLRSVFRYIRSLPITGEKMPAYVPPGQEPATAYVELVPQMPKTRAAVE